MTLPDIHPDFLARMRFMLGEDYQGYQEILDKPAESGLRVNTLKLSASDFSEISTFSLAPLPWTEVGFRIEATTATPGKHPYHSAGLYYLQDPSAMAVAELLAPEPGERVLDLAAAPGGKTTHLAACMRNRGLLVANEIHRQRAWNLAENLERCGVQHAVILNETPARLADHFGAYFDRVLVDAPCSGEGMFRKSAAARQAWSLELVASCAERQTAILEQAVRLVRPGGWLAYTTCTFSFEENEQVVITLLDQHPDFKPADLSNHHLFKHGRPFWASNPLPAAQWNLALNNATFRLWPHQKAAEGHFIALLRRKLEGLSDRSQGQPVKKVASNSNLNTAKQVFKEFSQAVLSGGTPLNAERLSLSGTYLYYQPEDLPELEGLRQIHPGWWLGMVKKNRFEPSHALALGMRAEGESRIEAQHILDLNAGDPQVLNYLRGESLHQPGENGWLVVCVDGFPLGWGKRTQGQIKNAYPRGLRWV